MADSTYSKLSDIIVKVRHLTRSPSSNQITDATITNYINTFILYDFPEQLRTFTLRKNLTLYTQPYVDIYEENTVNQNDPLYNFKNQYLSVHPPVYVSGNEVFYTQSEDQFYRLYPKITNQYLAGTGDGIIKQFSGTLTGIPFLRNAFIISSMDANGLGITGIDIPMTDPTTGNPLKTGYIVDAANHNSIYGTVNYLTGTYNAVFNSAPAASQPVIIQYVQYAVNVPQAVLYFDSKFVLRPVPDKAYSIQIDVMQRPSELIASNAVPELAEWWQYIAYGAAKKIFEDRMDPESVQIILPEFKNQQDLILRRTIKQYSNERSSTIYTDQTEALVSGWGRGGWF